MQVEAVKGTPMESLLKFTKEDVDDVKFYLHEWMDQDSYYFLPALKTLFELVVDECECVIEHRTSSDLVLWAILLSLLPLRWFFRSF